MHRNEVFVCNTSPTTLRKDVERILELSRLTRYYDTEKTTLIKINANYDRSYPGCNTSTWFLDALLSALKKLGFTDLTVVESDLKLQLAEMTIRVIGIKEVLEKHRIPFMNLEGCSRGKDELPFLVHEAQMINVPVVHTHTFAVISCASKNLFGLLPVYREKYHNELSERLLEIMRCVNPCFTIVDGTVGQEGGSMRMGNPRRLDLILAGWNPLTIDVVATKIMGFSTDNIPLLKLAKARGLVKEIIIKGDYASESLPIFNFKYKASKVAHLDLWLRRDFLTRWLFKYNSIPDRLAQHSRKLLLLVNYKIKGKRIFNGPWMEYHTALTYNTDA